MNKRGRGIGLIFLLIVTTGIVIMLYFLMKEPPPEDQAKEAVNTFYTYEQDGAFSESWAMFHPLMQEKFTKGGYIQDRAHVFMNHFGVVTFTYTLGEAVKVLNWEIEDGADPIPTVYGVTVTQDYKSKYGNFSIVQDVYATVVDDKWKIIWNYKK
ncbi:hypothetical protein [Virgibacillus sp. DJP39]|uniref:hypothetical protein n=1 Tax=Virgibacillus sp. DJP39 TaxID=3409790 RepID=UPI003BB6333E